MLQSLTIKEVYNSEDDDLLKDFYIPSLKNACSYDRAVGYFDARVLVEAASGLASFVQNNGYIRLIVGATLDEEEYKAIKNGYGERNIEEKLFQKIGESLGQDQSPLFKNQLNTLHWFIANKRMDVKIALRKGGIYHEKIGIIKDRNGDSLIFQGSANETTKALSSYNYESINVFKSWLPEFKGHIQPHIKKFETLWNDQARNTKVLSFTEIMTKALSELLPTPTQPNISRELDLWQQWMDEANTPTEESTCKGPHIPQKLYNNSFQLREHQRKALNSWKDNGFMGLFELATGAGKTITAIYGAVKVYESRNKLCLVVSVPYQSLADQWVENLRLFGINPVLCYGGEQRWVYSLKTEITDFVAGLTRFISAVVVDATLNSKSGTFKKLISQLSDDTEKYFLFVGDECHHHGAETTYKSLPLNASMRIGLSATPNRNDIEAPQEDGIKKYYGDTIASYTLADALSDDVLTPYEYHLIEVSLTKEETQKYIALSKRISKLFIYNKNNMDGKDSNSLNILFSKRARLINGTENKPIALQALLKDIPPKKHCLFYCAEGSVDDQTSEEQGIKQIQIISQLLHSMGWKSSQFTANEDKSQRQSILDNFKDGNIDALVAMKCLDEGIDIPACSTAFILASTRNPRQFIQRRGRILRKSPGKTKAVIYDFFVRLPIEDMEDSNFEKKLLIAELKRINEFASLALNKGEAYHTLEPFLKKHDLAHHLT